MHIICFQIICGHKEVILFSFSLVCYVAVCACIRAVELQSSKIKYLFYLKVKADPDRAKWLIHAPQVYVTMWKYLHNAAQMFVQRKKALFQ